MSKWMKEAVSEAAVGVAAGHGGPFGAVVVKDGAIVGRGHNEVLHRNDPTAHAEVQAIREACAFLGSPDLAGCTLYATCEPCPMCLAAIHWARLDRLVYAATKDDAAAAGFDDAKFHAALLPGAGGQPLIETAHEPNAAATKLLANYQGPIY